MSKEALPVLMSGDPLSWEEKAVTAVNNMRMPSNLRLPDMENDICITKLGMQCGELQLSRSTLLRYGDTFVAPDLFLFHGGVEVGVETMHFSPGNVHVLGTRLPKVWQATDTPVKVLVNLAAAQAYLPVFGASAEVQYMCQAGKAAFQSVWDAMAVVGDASVEFKDMTFFCEAMERGRVLQQCCAAGALPESFAHVCFTYALIHPCLLTLR